MVKFPLETWLSFSHCRSIMAEKRLITEDRLISPFVKQAFIAVDAILGQIPPVFKEIKKKCPLDLLC